MVERAEIEQVFGGPLEWDPGEDRRKCSVVKSIELGGYRDEDRWPEIQEAMITAMVNLHKAFIPRIKKLNL